MQTMMMALLLFTVIAADHELQWRHTSDMAYKTTGNWQQFVQQFNKNVKHQTLHF